MLKPPEGFTFQGMPRGWMKAKKSPALKALQKENEQLKEQLSSIWERLERMEERTT